MPTIKDSSSIEEVLQYIVARYGAEIYQEKQRLSNLIADLYSGEERLKRLYRRMVMEDAISQQLYSISLKPIQEREGFYNRLVYQFKEATFLEEAFARQSLDFFAQGLHLLLAEPACTKAAEEDGEWVDKYEVKYSADRKKLIKWKKVLYNYNILEGTEVICDEAFDWCKSLGRIIIPDSVTLIGDRAFYGCENLKSIIIPNLVTSIGDRAFCKCKELRRITIPASVTSIGDGAFSYCPNLILEVDKDSSYFCVESRVLYSSDKKNLIWIPCDIAWWFTIPDSVISIGDYAFLECKSLDSIVIPDSVISIGKEAFCECGNLRGAVVPASVTLIGDRAFYKCESLKRVVLPASVTSIGNNVFFWCKSLISINIPVGTLEKFKKLLPKYIHLLHETNKNRNSI